MGRTAPLGWRVVPGLVVLVALAEAAELEEVVAPVGLVGREALGERVATAETAERVVLEPPSPDRS